MTINVEPHRDGDAFLSKAQAYLEANEAANNLMLGLAFRLRDRPEHFESSPYLVTAERETKLVAAGVMTPPRHFLIYSDGQAPDQVFDLIAQTMVAGQETVPGVLGPSAAAKQFADAWGRLSGQSYKPGMRQRIYQLRQVIEPEARPPGRLRRATGADMALATQWVFAFGVDAFGQGNMAESRVLAQRKIEDGDLYLWVDGVPVSMAAKTRPTSTGICLNLVYTPPELRQRGYATVCVASLSQHLLEAGRQFCCLFTDLANPTSNSIYQKIGYTPVCDFNEYLFV